MLWINVWRGIDLMEKYVGVNSDGEIVYNGERYIVVIGKQI